MELINADSTSQRNKTITRWKRRLRVVGLKDIYNMELTGVECTPARVRQLWDKLLSKAT